MNQPAPTLSIESLDRINHWMDITEPRAAAVNERYRDQNLLRHYRQVCLYLFQFTNDEALAKAGYLHGVGRTFLKEVIEDGVNEIYDLLEGRRRIQAVLDDPKDTQRFVNKFLRTIEDPRSAILLVVETLHHADCEGIMAEFCKNFHSQPTELPAEVPAIRPPNPSLLRLIVAPLSKFLGLWHERNLAEDLAMYHEDQKRMTEVLQFVRSDEVVAEITERLKLIHRVLAQNGRMQEFKSNYRWHHLASIARRLEDGGHLGKMKHRVSLASEVLIECADEQQCYEALGVLSLSDEFKKHHREFEDTLAQPKQTGFRAIRTTLVHQPAGAMATLIRVEILPPGTENERLRPLNLSRLNEFSQSRSARRKHMEKFEVFAYDGRSVQLPHGARVLNFVSQIHGDLVARARGAIVNRNRVDLLTPLQPGDIVQIDTGTELRELPLGWQDQVPPETVNRIRESHRKVLKRVLAENEQDRKRSLAEKGRQYLKSELFRCGIEDVESIETAALDSFVEECALSLSKQLNLSDPPDSWLDQIGQFACNIGQEEGQQPTVQSSVLTPALVERFVQALIQLVTSSPRVHRNMISVPESLFKKGFDQIKICSRCSPTVSSDVIGKIDERNLVLHEAGRTCAAQGEPVEWKRCGTRPQYFLVEAWNRVGLAADVLNAVKQKGLDILEHCGTSIGPGLAVFRFSLQGITSTAIASLESSILQISGVQRVFGPNDATPQFLEAPLPPRNIERSAISVSKPLYICGPAIREDAYFYGRENELDSLEALVNECKMGERGQLVFVTGPLKVGKTSLLNRLSRRIRANDPGCAIVHSMCPWGGGWDEVASDLRSTLITQIHGQAAYRGSDTPHVPTDIGLREGVDLFLKQSGSTLLFIIDEAMRILSRNPKETLEFLGWALNRRGVCVILCGPKTSIRRLVPDCQYLFRSSHNIPVSGLNEDEVRSLLRAEKLGVKWVKVSKEDAIAVHKATGGNPYWCSVIAKAIMDFKFGDLDVTYNSEIIERAEDKAISSLETFLDRFTDSAWTVTETTIARNIFSLIADRPDNMPSITEPEILDQLSRTLGTAHTTEAISMLFEMADRGTLQRFEELGLPIWQFGSPLLRRYYAQCRKEIEDHWRLK